MPESPSTSRLELSPIQLIASALAAASAAVIASYFGVNGTVIGAAVASVVATAGSAVYSHSIQRTHDGMRRLRTIGAPGNGRPSEPKQRSIRWPAVAAAAALVFGGAIVAVTLGELVAHRPLASVVAGRPDRGTTSIGSIVQGGRAPAKPPAQPTPVTSPSAPQASPSTRGAVPSPAPSPTAVPDRSPTPAATPSATLSPVPTP